MPDTFKMRQPCKPPAMSSSWSLFNLSTPNARKKLGKYVLFWRLRKLSYHACWPLYKWQLHRYQLFTLEMRRGQGLREGSVRRWVDKHAHTHTHTHTHTYTHTHIHTHTHTHTQLTQCEQACQAVEKELLQHRKRWEETVLNAEQHKAVIDELNSKQDVLEKEVVEREKRVTELEALVAEVSEGCT